MLCCRPEGEAASETCLHDLLLGLPLPFEPHYASVYVSVVPAPQFDTAGCGCESSLSQTLKAVGIQSEPAGLAGGEVAGCSHAPAASSAREQHGIGRGVPLLHLPAPALQWSRLLAPLASSSPSSASKQPATPLPTAGPARGLVPRLPAVPPCCRTL